MLSPGWRKWILPETERDVSGESARVGEMQIARHSDCEDELVGLQEAVWQAALSAAKAWQTGD